MIVAKTGILPNNCSSMNCPNGSCAACKLVSIRDKERTVEVFDNQQRFFKGKV